MSERESILTRLATAPISWGICEVPGWGHQLEVDRVLSEMVELGFTSTELGSPGWLPDDPSRLNAMLAAYDLDLLAAFVPLVLHDPALADESLKRARATANRLEAMGATYFNTAPVTSWDWSRREPVSAAGWDHVMAMFAAIDDIVAEHNLVQVLHSHVDTVVETADEVQRCIDNSDVKFVLDTAHFAIGGVDVRSFAETYAERVGLVHIKDLDISVATRLNDDELTLMEAVQAGIFPPVGHGDLDIGGVMSQLEIRGYQGWYVLEQDVAITGDVPAPGEGPVLAVGESLAWLQAHHDASALAQPTKNSNVIP